MDCKITAGDSRVLTSANARQLPDNFSAFRNYHKDETIIVCGCGESLNELTDPGRFISIGVNDVGRLFDPTYLLVVNPEKQFKADRFSYIQSSRALAVFSQLRRLINHPKLIQFKLGQRGGTEITALDVLPYTRNSPYIAVCLAAYMGARRIGLIGVDLTDKHFFADTGKHALSAQCKQIDFEYANLAKAFLRKDIELVNISSVSRIRSMPFMPINDFMDNRHVSPSAMQNSNKYNSHLVNVRKPVMKLAIEKYKPGIIGDFFDELTKTANSLGYEINRNPQRNPQINPQGNQAQNEVLSIVWNGRNFHGTGPVLYCEHGWLPRWDYQISPKGINADSHIAPFVWDGKTIDNSSREMLNQHLQNIRNGEPAKNAYMQTNVTAAQGTPDAFLLVPLQIENDTNILRHVPASYRRMQAFIDAVSKASPPLPIIFKQHPADTRNGNRHLRLKVQRAEDSIWNHDRGNIHQLLKSGKCKGVISLNSNVVHDALVWGVPSIVLGKNIWSGNGEKEQISPFMERIPVDWNKQFFNRHETKQISCTEAYAYYLMQNQWSLQDIKDKTKVAQLFEKTMFDYQKTVRKKIVKLPCREKPLINVVAKNRGWLFEDLKKHFVCSNSTNVSIQVSERALPGADSWIYLRTKEAAFSPDPSRTVVQIHDMYDTEEYLPGGARHIVNRCGAIVLTHPEQRQLLGSKGIDLRNKLLLEKPMGALSPFCLKQKLADKFTIAWVGRPVMYKKQDIKRFNWFMQAVNKLTVPVRIVLAGDKLANQANELIRAGYECEYYPRSTYPYVLYPQLYKQFDCVVITAEKNSRQNSLFEALKSGVPVIATPTAWVNQYVKNNINGYIVNSADEISASINKIYSNRQSWFERKQNIRDSVIECSLEAWLRENITLSLSLIDNRKGQVSNLQSTAVVSSRQRVNN